MQAAPSRIEDWRTFSTDVTIAAATLGDGLVSVAWSDGRRSPFHFDWLRDTCSCPACVHAQTREQVFEIVDAPDALAVRGVQVGRDGALHVEWRDGHRSAWPPGWLRAHAYDDASRAERHAAQGRRVWTGDDPDAIAVFAWRDVMHGDAALRAWLGALQRTGLTLVEGVPPERGRVDEIARRVGLVRETNFGALFDVESKPRPDSNAYTSINLPPHTDLPTRELQPGVQFLHCLANDATGGDSIFIDGFALADALRDAYPDDFALLATTPFEFWNKSAASDYRCSAPVIGLNARREVIEVRHANFLRGPVDAPAASMPAIYRAYRRFLALAREPRLRVQRRLRAGDMWAFDNRRVLHARTEFDPSTGRRHLQGCYVDRDELLSRWRVLSRAATPTA
ncbi:gamma-butyrobetaine dioxygenase [Burkholderia ubonensis]|uniref:TauD/TfdA family dioxygenase n=1 Tax=Burkholderia ubonensis TaxID=101571 RepID=UPI0007594238|nr:TauD/TfdA family dioxygenase [Burkholderia ubonensis]KVU52223.1 gamma-butyrobetaine dioxygenase [Burkholderia ubonensis]